MRSFRQFDAAGADQRERALRPNISLGQHAVGERQERPPGKATRFSRLGIAQIGGPGHGGIADDHAVDTARARDSHHIVETAKR